MGRILQNVSRLAESFTSFQTSGFLICKGGEHLTFLEDTTLLLEEFIVWIIVHYCDGLLT